MLDGSEDVDVDYKLDGEEVKIIKHTAKALLDREIDKGNWSPVLKFCRIAYPVLIAITGIIHGSWCVYTETYHLLIVTALYALVIPLFFLILGAVLYKCRERSFRINFFLTPTPVHMALRASLLAFPISIMQRFEPTATTSLISTAVFLSINIVGFLQITSNPTLSKLIQSFQPKIRKQVKAHPYLKFINTPPTLLPTHDKTYRPIIPHNFQITDIKALQQYFQDNPNDRLTIDYSKSPSTSICPDLIQIPLHLINPETIVFDHDKSDTYGMGCKRKPTKEYNPNKQTPIEELKHFRSTYSNYSHPTLIQTLVIDTHRIDLNIIDLHVRSKSNDPSIQINSTTLDKLHINNSNISGDITTPKQTRVMAKNTTMDFCSIDTTQPIELIHCDCNYLTADEVVLEDSSVRNINTKSITSDGYTTSHVSLRYVNRPIVFPPNLSNRLYLYSESSCKRLCITPKGIAKQVFTVEAMDVFDHHLPQLGIDEYILKLLGVSALAVPLGTIEEVLGNTLVVDEVSEMMDTTTLKRAVEDCVVGLYSSHLSKVVNIGNS